jgi:alanine racemase
MSLDWIQEAARFAQQPFDFHLKIDTGLNRLGFKTLDEVREVMKITALNSNVNCT